MLSNGLLFLVSDQGIATCLRCDDGETCWRKRLGGEFYASPVALGDYVYFCDMAGRTTVIDASDAFQEVATNELGEPAFASIALADDGLYIRGETRLVRVDYDGAEPATSVASAE
ncbi:MAG: PQQ-binding-like beta-propeller repeat protein [Pirellulales bacterium]